MNRQPQYQSQRQRTGSPGGDRTQYVSHDPIDYKTHILYIAPNNPGSKIALELAPKGNEIQIKNVTEMQKSEIPNWLNGVPTLFDVREKRIFKGTHALNELKTLNGSQLSGISNNKGIGYDFKTFETTSSTCSSGCEIEPIIDDESKYRGDKGKNLEASIEKMKEIRDRQMQKIKPSSAQVPAQHIEFPQ